VTHFSSSWFGDPIVLVGRLTVVLYLVTSVSCWILVRKPALADARRSRERRAWRAISILFLLLGINRQLDLLTTLTQAARILAGSEGWYEQRQPFQLGFIGLVAVICFIAGIAVLIWARDAPICTWLATIGTTLVSGYVLIRAASFHYVDRFIGQTVFGFRWNWILEISGIALVLLTSQWRQVQLRNRDRGSFH
jgi:hypothetical protein